jgi:hypothetical protein
VAVPGGDRGAAELAARLRLARPPRASDGVAGAPLDQGAWAPRFSHRHRPHGDLDATGPLHQERHRVELQQRAVEALAGPAASKRRPQPPQRSSPPASSGRSNAARQRGHRSAYAYASASIETNSSAAPATSRRSGPPLTSAASSPASAQSAGGGGASHLLGDAAAGRSGSHRERRPARRRRLPPPLHLDGAKLRRRLEPGVLDRELQGDGGGGAPVAGSLDSHAGHAACDLEELDVTPVRAEVGADFPERRGHALLHGVRMELVQQEQVGERVVFRELTELWASAQALDDPAGPSAVDLEQGDAGLGRRGSRALVRKLGDLLEQALGGRDLLGARRPPLGVRGVAEHRRVDALQRLPLAQVHVHPAGQAGVEAPCSAQMSMPRKSSGPFSSKMGIPCTASS